MSWVRPGKGPKGHPPNAVKCQGERKHGLIACVSNRELLSSARISPGMEQGLRDL